MRRDVKLGGFVGAVFSGLAYLITYRLGFNPSSLSYLLYLYVLLGAVVAVDYSSVLEGRDIFDRILIAGKEEENKLKKLFSDEVYKIDGTVEKLEDQ
ncbi:MAG: hypothetical protein ABEJ36_06010 [Candidatus Nanosalina sp.]